jgi:hypothetical protein
VKRAILLLVDGLRPDVAEAELDGGHLPHLARLVARGTVARAATAFPSTTSVSYLPFLTGCLPGRCNVPSIRWLDRRLYRGRWWRDRAAVRSYCGYQAGMLDGDIAADVRTIFELVPESAAFFTMISRGLSPERDPAQGARRFWGALSHYLLWHQPGDEAVIRHLLGWVDRDAGWRFLFAQFPGVDGYTHQLTPHHPRVRAALRRFDAAVGALVDRLDRRRLLDDTLILVVSDHGATTVREHLDLAVWFRGRGIPTLAHPVVWSRRPRAAVMVAGNGSAMVYARPEEPRDHRWPLNRLRRRDAFGSDDDLVDALTREPAVAFVAAEDPERGLAVVDRSGEARIEAADGRVTYRRLTGDPLRIGSDFSGDRRQWLHHSFHTTYPDAAVQLVDQFRAPRTGDLVVAAQEGYDFRDRWEIPEHRSGHGSMIRAHMQTPLWANRAGPVTAIRTADVFASLLAWLDVPLPAGIDGELAWSPGRVGSGADDVTRRVVKGGVGV